jgi:hypothetical protein
MGSPSVTHTQAAAHLWTGSPSKKVRQRRTTWRFLPGCVRQDKTGETPRPHFLLFPNINEIRVKLIQQHVLLAPGLPQRVNVPQSILWQSARMFEDVKQIRDKDARHFH